MAPGIEGNDHEHRAHGFGTRDRSFGRVPHAPVRSREPPAKVDTRREVRRESRMGESDEPDERAVLAQLERGPAAGLVEEFQPQPDPGRPSGAGYRADVGVRDQQFILDDLVQCHIDRRAASRVRVAHQHKTQETTGPGVAFRRLARHGETRGPEPLAQLVGIDEGPVDQFARRVEDARDGDFLTVAHRRQTSPASRRRADCQPARRSMPRPAVGYRSVV